MQLGPHVAVPAVVGAGPVHVARHPSRWSRCPAPRLTTVGFLQNQKKFGSFPSRRKFGSFLNRTHWRAFRAAALRSSLSMVVTGLAIRVGSRQQQQRKMRTSWGYSPRRLHPWRTEVVRRGRWGSSAQGYRRRPDTAIALPSSWQMVVAGAGQVPIGPIEWEHRSPRYQGRKMIPERVGAGDAPRPR